MNSRYYPIAPWVLFACLGCLLFFLGQAGQPPVHPYFDQVGIRDAGTVFSHYISGPGPLKTIIGRAMLHIEGPLQFLLLTAYCYAVGDMLPLNPSVLQFPNTILALLAALMAYFLGTKIVSRRVGYCCAIAFATSPWLGEAVRQPWIFNTLSCFLHFSTFYSFLGLCEDPNSRRHRLIAPASLAAYLFVGLDWPSFLFSLGFFIVACRRVRVILKNPYNFLVLAAAAVQIAWPAALFFTGRANRLHETLLLYPFHRYGELSSNLTLWFEVWRDVIVGWGPQLMLAIVGLVVYVIRLRREMFRDRLRRAMFDSMCIWFVGASYALFRSCTSATYLYVVAVPTSLLAGLVLSRVRIPYAVFAAIGMAVFQVTITASQQFTSPDDGRRVLAAAAFLIERRPDLLTDEKTAFLPRNVAADVGQYARGKNKRIIMPQEFPVELRKHSVGSDDKVLRKFVETYKHNGGILADWLILDSELFSSDLQAAGFYTRIRNDRTIHWVARFRDPGGELIIGEVLSGKQASESTAPLEDTDRWSETYNARYDRIGFLKKNVQYVDHY